MMYSQPQYGPLEIYAANPITRGLKFAQVGTNSANSLAWKAGVVNASAYVKTSKRGIGFGMTAFAAIRSINAYPTNGAVWSCFAVAMHDGATTGTQSILDNDDSGTGGNARHFQFRVNASAVELIRFSNGGSPYFATGVALSSAQLLEGLYVGAVCDGNSIASYSNGIKTSGTITGTPSTGSVTGDWRFGNFKGNSSTPWKGSLPLMLIWDRALSDVEMKSLRDNPWQIFTSPRTMLMSVGGGPQTQTVTPTGGLAFSGVSPYLRSLVKSVSGGVLLSGTSPVVTSAVQTLVVTPSGGFLLAGTATNFRSVIRAISGGVLFSGTAPPTLFPDPTPASTRHNTKRGNRRARTRINY